jgi:tRNA(Ile)-lysidine synthase TilS/MesJ
MKKLELKRINLEEAGISQSDIITKKQQRHILGGYGSGTCGWNGAGILKPVCNISKVEAESYATIMGGYWCCDSCCNTEYCAPEMDC